MFFSKAWDSTRLWKSCPRSWINIIVVNEIQEFVGLTFITNKRGILSVIMSNHLSPKSQSKLHQYSSLWRSKRNYNFLVGEKIKCHLVMRKSSTRNKKREMWLQMNIKFCYQSKKLLRWDSIFTLEDATYLRKRIAWVTKDTKTARMH